MLSEPRGIGIRNAHKAGFWYGYSLFIRFAFIGFTYYIAALLIFRLGLDSRNTFIAVYILFISALGSGISIANAPSVSKAKDSANRVFEIIHEESAIDARKETGEKLVKEGDIEFINVDFVYPSR